MHRGLWVTLLVSSGALAAEPSVIQRGQPLPKGTPVSVDVVLKEAKDGQPVLVEGTVRRACSHRGCWMELASASQGLRVTFKDYGFFVPTDSAGARARVAGAVTVTTLSREEADHLAGEGAALERAPDGTAREVRVVATGVELRR
ncbi:MAG TPA: DUF4920 domain-containing protein [Myxococcaceae bacterium]|nr:DUF4920 domain-containing protein [Myxococcaceae bacterium]